MRTVRHHVGGTLAVVALFGLRREATLFGMMVQTTTIITAAGRDKLNQKSDRSVFFLIHSIIHLIFVPQLIRKSWITA